jgi:hypothetical protein
MAVPDLLNNPLGLSSFTGSPVKEKPAVAPSSQMGFPAIERPADPRPEIERRRGEIGTETANIDAKIIQNLADQGQFQAQQEKQKVESEAKSLRELDTSRKALEKSLYESTAYKTIQEKSKELAEKSTFNPDQQNAQTLAAVFSIIGAAGFLLGGNNKNTAKSALAAMNGMAEGYSKGRDQYAKDQRQAFETNQKALRGTLDSLEKAFTYELEQNKNDLESATRNAKIAALERDASFINANIDKYGLVSTLEQLRSNKKRLETVLGALQKKEDAYSAEMQKEWFANESRKAIAQASKDKVEYENRERERRDIERREDTQSFQREMARYRVQNRPDPGVQPIGMADGKLVVMDKSGKITSVDVPEGFTGTGKLAEKTPKTPGARDAYGFGEIVAGASNEAAKTLTNIMGLPAESTSGIFGGRQTTSLFTAPIDAFANRLTPESAQRYQAEMNKLAYYIAQMQKGGRVVGATEVGVINKSLEIRENDTIETVATRLAQARQMAEKIIEIKVASLNTPEPLKEIYKENLKDIQQSVPFTVEDINKFVQRKTGAPTFGESFKERYKTPEPTADDRALGKSSPEMRKKFVAKFGVEP